jgi:hypothetical protein
MPKKTKKTSSRRPPSPRLRRGSSSRKRQAKKADKLAPAHPKSHQEPTRADHRSFVKANHDNDQSRILRERNARQREVNKATKKRKTTRVSARARRR